MQRLVLLDSNSLINRAYYALPNLTNKKGEHTGAIFGYVNMLIKLINTYNPTHIIAVFDRKAPTFRKLMYEGYKATRKPMPQELASQLQPLKDLLTAMNIPIAEMDGFEADDIIGTLAKRYNCETYIVTGDRDSLQLIDDTTTVLLTKKGITEIASYDENLLASEGLRPSQIIDLKSLMGDSSDNIPGVAGVGEKTAKDLLAKYDTLDGVYAHIDEIKGKLKEKLESSKELAYLSYKLATIDTNCPIQTDLEKAKVVYPLPAKAKDMLLELEFNKIADRLEFEQSQKTQSENTIDIIKIEDEQALQNIIKEISESKQFAFEIGTNCYLSCSLDRVYEIIISDNLLGEGISYNDFISAIKVLTEDESVRKICFDLKSYMHTLDSYGIIFKGRCDDILLKAYLCDSNRTYKSLKELMTAYGFVQENADSLILRLEEVLDKEMQEKEQKSVYENIELPLVKVLFKMEKQGFTVNRQYLAELNEKMSAELGELSQLIIDLAGEPFNINSTQQLAHILFEKLGLKKGKKTKTGYSTNVEVLNSLKNEHAIIPAILQYRELSKLKSTYLEGMIPLIDKNNRIHTVFKQAVTATGRLSSTEPNLQNIPIRKESGKQIRKMFVSSPSNVLVCGDYSQIELRLMACMSGDKVMIDAFNGGADFHSATASKLFGVSIDDVTQDMRRSAKAVNFGIIYGISDFGLSEDLGVSVYQARQYINNYFATYPQVKEFMDACVDFAKKNGYVKTLDGRRRYIPELNSSNYNMRSFGERVAMNMPLQGTASDIIKKAMIEVNKRLEEGKFEAKLIMQVHDELIIDCPEKEKDEVLKLLKDSMQNVASLAVELVADVGYCNNWLEAK